MTNSIRSIWSNIFSSTLCNCSIDILIMVSDILIIFFKLTFKSTWSFWVSFVIRWRNLAPLYWVTICLLVYICHFSIQEWTSKLIHSRKKITPSNRLNSSHIIQKIEIKKIKFLISLYSDLFSEFEISEIPESQYCSRHWMEFWLSSRFWLYLYYVYSYFIFLI